LRNARTALISERNDKRLVIYSPTWIQIKYRFCAILARIPYMNVANQHYVKRARLTDIAGLNRIARGVNMDITQLDPGAFESDVIQLKVRNVFASLVTSNRRLRLQGNLDFLTVSFLTGQSGSPKWRGIPVASSDVVAANANEEFDLVVPPGLEAYCVSVVGIGEATLRNLGGPVLARKLARTAGPITCAPTSVQEICRWFADQFEGFDCNTNINNGPASILEVEFLRRLAACMRAGTPSADSKSMPSGRIDVVRRVEQHLLDDLAVPQTVDDLCRIANASRRTLEYSFKDYFGTSPKRFIKALKLNAARDDLLTGSYGFNHVVEIASGLGFTHMGQFSADYRNMFGEKPSETLRRGP
jgi:AraC family ethanolamine operon transcriptional activator